MQAKHKPKIITSIPAFLTLMESWSYYTPIGHVLEVYDKPPVCPTHWQTPRKINFAKPHQNLSANWKNNKCPQTFRKPINLAELTINKNQFRTARTPQHYLKPDGHLSQNSPSIDNKMVMAWQSSNINFGKSPFNCKGSHFQAHKMSSFSIACLPPSSTTWARQGTFQLCCNSQPLSRYV